MNLVGEQILFRAYLDSADRRPHTPTYERLVKAARHEGLAGGTVLQGLLGFGSHGMIKRSTWSVVEHVPVIVEIVDAAERIRDFVEGAATGLLAGRMVTLERACVLLYRHGQESRPTNLALGTLLKPLSTLPQIAQGEVMQAHQDGVLVRVFVGESDRYEHQPLYEAIVQKTRELGLAGATVLRGTEGFGAHSVVHKASLLEMSRDLPIVVEIVDVESQIQLLLPHLENMVHEGMITMEYVVILLYQH